MRDKRTANGLFMGQVDTFLAYHRLTCSAAARQEITLSLGRVARTPPPPYQPATLAQEIQEETIKEHNTRLIQHKLPGSVVVGANPLTAPDKEFYCGQIHRRLTTQKLKALRAKLKRISADSRKLRYAEIGGGRGVLQD